jgi:hypothetical protein
LSVLARDLQEDLFIHFHVLFKVLVKRLDSIVFSGSLKQTVGSIPGTGAPNPELTGKLFECLSYMMKYLLSKLSSEPDEMRQYYGATLGHSTAFVRDFAAKSFMVLFRKFKQKTFRVHYKKLLKAISVNCKSAYLSMSYDDSNTGFNVIEIEEEKDQFSAVGKASLPKKVRDIIDGVALLTFYSCKGVKGCLHSEATNKVSVLLELIFPIKKSLIEEIDMFSNSFKSNLKQQKNKKNSKEIVNNNIIKSDDLPLELKKKLELITNDSRYNILVCGQIISDTMRRLFRHVRPSALEDLWKCMLIWIEDLLASWKCLSNIQNISQDIIDAMNTSTLYVVEVFIFALWHSNGRGIGDKNVRNTLSKAIINNCLDLCEVCTNSGIISNKLILRIRSLFCKLWIRFPSDTFLTKRIEVSLNIMMQSLEPTPAVLSISNELLTELPDKIVRQYLVKTVLTNVTLISSSCESSQWLSVLMQIFMKLKDCRDDGRGLLISNESLEKTSKPRRLGKKFTQNVKEKWGNDDDDDFEESGDEGMIDEVEDDYFSDVDSDEDVIIENNSLESLLNICDKQMISIADNCLNIMRTFTNSSSESNDSKVFILACSCLRWFMMVYPTIFSNKLILPKLSNLLREIVSKYGDITAFNELKDSYGFSLFAYFTRFLCTQKDHVQLSKKINFFPNLLKYYIQLVINNPKSLSLLWGLHGLLEISSTTLESIISNNEIDPLLEAIGIALVTPSYWLRISLLRLLTYLPNPILVELESTSKGGKTSNGEEIIPESIDIARLCLEAACTSVQLATERDYTFRLSNLEVLMRGGRLPKTYERIICSFCIGMLNVKFKSFWEPSILVLITAANRDDGEALVWPLLLDVLQYLGDERSIVSEVDTSGSNRFDLNICLDEMNRIDSGDIHITKSFSSSEIFFYKSEKLGKYQDNSVVESDARVDTETVYASVWSILKRCPIITLRRSKSVVPIFLKFLNTYYDYFSDDAEVPYLHRIGLLSNDNSVKDSSVPKLSMKILKKRLEMFLSVFSVVTSPKQLYQHQILFNYYNAILSKPDIGVVKLSFDCILQYKPVYIMPYKDNIKRMMEDKSLRDEIVVFNPAEIDGTIDSRHREDIVPVVIRIVYGRFVSKSRGSKAAREIGLARRVAVLSFIARFTQKECQHFIHLMFRGMVSKEKMLSIACIPEDKVKENQLQNQNQLLSNHQHVTLTEQTKQWYIDVEECIMSLTMSDMANVAWERQVGYLHLCEHVIRTLGFGISNYVAPMCKLVHLMISHAQEIRNIGITTIEDVEPEDVGEYDNDGIEEDHDTTIVKDISDEDFKFSSEIKGMNQSARVRTMCLLRLSEIVHQYHKVFDFNLIKDDTFAPIMTLIDAVPSSISGSSRPPAIIKLIHALIQYDETNNIIVSNDKIVVAVIKCIASKTEFDVAKVIMDIISELLSRDDGISILPHAQLIIECFSKRFVGDSYGDEIYELKLSELKITPSGSVKQELKLLCRIAEGVFSRGDVSIDSLAVSNLSTLLLGMLRTYTTSRKVRVEEDWVIDILRIYKSLLWRVKDVQPHIPFISRLFGPASHSFSLFNFASVRKVLATVFVDLSKHPSTNNLLTISANALAEITSMDALVLDSKDFGRVMPVFQSLSGETKTNVSSDLSWSHLLGPKCCSTPREASICVVIVHECMRCMFDREMIVRSASLSSLKRLIDDTGSWSGAIVPAGKNKNEINEIFKKSKKNKTTYDIAWLDVLTSIVIPGIRRGIKQSTDIVKKGFVSLLAHVVSTLGISKILIGNEMFHGDLVCLLHDDPEQDFFENIVHIQLHRRVRAFAKLKAFLLDYKKRNDKIESENSGMSINVPNCPLDIASLQHVLLPLGYHPIVSEEFIKKDHLSYMQEASVFIGTIGLFLPWSHYLSSMKTILKQLDRNKSEKEKVLLGALCNLLESFHFDTSGGPDITNELKSLNNIDENLNEDDSTNDKEIEQNDDDDNDDDNNNNNNEIIEAVVTPNKSITIVNSVTKSIIPWVRGYLLKEGVDHKGNKSHTVRTQIAVALSKLIKRLQAPLVSEETKKGLFTNLVITVVGTLKSRDASARDTARDSLSKMIKTMGLHTLQLVLQELQHFLTEGFQRHICNYTIRSLLSTVLDDYSPPTNAPSVPVFSLGEGDLLPESIKIEKPIFDECIPNVIQSCLDDLVGLAHDDRTADGADRVVIREAKGSKSNEILEISAKNILFRPTYALQSLENPSSVSSIHALSTPLLSQLINCESPDVIGRISEALQRIALGLSHNPSVTSQELLLYLHATLQPFVVTIIQEHQNRKKALGKLLRPDDKDGESDDEGLDDELPSYLREESSDEDEFALYSKKKKSKRKDNVTGYRASIWLPSEHKGLNNQRSVIDKRDQERYLRDKVFDGASAPKLTGFNRYRRGREFGGSSSGTADADPAAVAAVKFCLSIFNASLKQNRLNSEDKEVRSMTSPFLPLLGQCLRLHGAANVVTLSMRCLCTLLTWNLPVEITFTRAVGSRMLKLMFKGGAIVSTDSELVQACIKGMTAMFQLYNKKTAEEDQASSNTPVVFSEEKNKLKQSNLPLSEEKIRSLLQLMTVSIMDVTSSFQNAAFQLIRSVFDTRIIIPEIYDLVTKLMDQIVLSHRIGVRDSASSVVIAFILNYPLGDKRLATHIKQFIANCSYEFEEGRTSALESLANLTKVLPIAILDEYSQMIFMSMSLRIVNDPSASCRQGTAQIILNIARRSSPESVNILTGYALKWLSSDMNSDIPSEQTKALVRTGSQVAGILLAGRPDIFKKGNGLQQTVTFVKQALNKLMKQHALDDEGGRRGSLEKREMSKTEEGLGESGGVETWAVIYHLLMLFEQAFTHLPAATDFACTHISNEETTSQGPMLMESIQETMLFPHSWVRSVSCRILKLYLSRRDVTRARLATSSDGIEFLLAPNSMYHLARKLCIVVNQPFLDASLLEAVTSSLVFVIRAMDKNADLHSITSGGKEEEEEDDDNEENEDEVEVVKTINSRNVSGANWVIQRLRGLGIDPRARRRVHVMKVFTSLVSSETSEFISTYAKQIIEIPIRATLTVTGPDEALLKECKDAGTELLELIEKKIGSSLFIGVFGEVQTHIQGTKSQQKRERLAEAILNPKAHALKKIAKTEGKKESKKRKTLRHTAITDLSTKRLRKTSDGKVYSINN